LVAQWQVTPAVGVLYQHQYLDGFNKTVTSTNPLASAFALQGMHSTYTTMQPYAVVSFMRPFAVGSINYVPQFEVGYRYDTRNGNGLVVNTLGRMARRLRYGTMRQLAAWPWRVRASLRRPVHRGAFTWITRASLPAISMTTR
jgi:hypothetical protein